MQLTKICAIAIAAIAMTSVANAGHSSSPCGSSVETFDTGAAILYLVNDDTGTWLYLEQNGHEGLQRGGAAWYEAGTGNGIDADCWDVDTETGEDIENPDFIIL